MIPNPCPRVASHRGRRRPRFVGALRQQVGGDDFYVDLLLFHIEQLRYVVELKIGRFKPDYTGQLGFYVALVDDQSRKPDRHATTVGILLCAGRNDRIVRHSLGAAAAPMAVAGYTWDTLPADERSALPTAGDVAAVLDAPLGGQDPAARLADALPGDDDPAP